MLSHVAPQNKYAVQEKLEHNQTVAKSNSYKINVQTMEN